MSTECIYIKVGWRRLGGWMCQWRFRWERWGRKMNVRRRRRVNSEESESFISIFSTYTLHTHNKINFFFYFFVLANTNPHNTIVTSMFRTKSNVICARRRQFTFKSDNRRTVSIFIAFTIMRFTIWPFPFGTMAHPRP